MNRTGFPSRLAQFQMKLALRLMPPSRRDWGNGMRAELAHISDDWEAWQWSAGCLSAAIGERIRIMHVLDSAPVRLGIVLVLLFKIADDVFATVGTIAYKLGSLGFVEAWGRQTPGDDYARLVPLIEAVPVWLHGLWLLAAAAFLVAILMVLLGSRSAYLLVLAGMGFELVAELLGRPIINATGVVVTANPSPIRTFVIPLAIPLAIALVLWLARRPTSTPLPQTQV